VLDLGRPFAGEGEQSSAAGGEVDELGASVGGVGTAREVAKV